MPGAAIASDQLYREADLAIDFCEDVPPLPPTQVDRIVELFAEAGAVAKISSIHVNGWFGDYDKLTMTRRFARRRFRHRPRRREATASSSSATAPTTRRCSAIFPNACGVANVRDFADRMPHLPAYVTEGRGGAGFVEIAEALLSAR